MKLNFSKLAESTDVEVTIHSLERSIYQLTALVNGVEHLVVEDSQKPVRTRSLQKMREMLAGLPIASVTLRHESAYDEMVGQPLRQCSNALEINMPPVISANTAATTGETD